MAPFRAAETPSFVTGPIMRHMILLAGTGAIGMIAVFGVDLLNLLDISLLGQRAIAARQNVNRVLEGDGPDAGQPTADFHSDVGGIRRDLVEEEQPTRFGGDRRRIRQRLHRIGR